MIKLFNNLNSVQQVRIRDRLGSYYTIYVEANKSVELESYQISQDILDKVKLGSVSLSNEDSFKSSLASNVPIVNFVEEKETIKEPDENQETVDANEITSTNDNNSNEESEDICVCELCGAEFASKRALSMHVSRSHSNK